MSPSAMGRRQHSLWVARQLWHWHCRTLTCSAPSRGRLGSWQSERGKARQRQSEDRGKPECHTTVLLLPKLEADGLFGGKHLDAGHLCRSNTRCSSLADNPLCPCRRYKTALEGVQAAERRLALCAVPSEDDSTALQPKQAILPGAAELGSRLGHAYTHLAKLQLGAGLAHLQVGLAAP